MTSPGSSRQILRLTVRSNQEHGPPDPGKFPGPDQDQLSKTAADKDNLAMAKQASAIEHFNTARTQEKERRSVLDLFRWQRHDKQGLIAEHEAQIEERQEKEQRARTEAEREIRRERDKDYDETRTRRAFQ